MSDKEEMSLENKTWIGVDFDGTLAHYHEWEGPQNFGNPIPLMLNRVKDWIAKGKTVKILTARVGYASIMDDPNVKAGRDNYQDLRHMITFSLQDWCEENGLPRLTVTAEKDYLMTEFWDDRAIQVVPNKGFSVMELMEHSPKNAISNPNPAAIGELIEALEITTDNLSSILEIFDALPSHLFKDSSTGAEIIKTIDDNIQHNKNALAVLNGEGRLWVKMTNPTTIDMER